MLTLDEIDRMTRAEGAGWGYPHVQRDLKLIQLIRGDISCDDEVLTWAVYLHDWGAFPRYAQPGVDHALRSHQIAATEILPNTHFTDQQKKMLLECIEKHDYRDPRSVNAVEALLLREADWLDMLGVIGIVRDCAWGPNQLRTCYDRIVMHRNVLHNRFTLPIARQIAAERIAQMDLVLAQLIAESFDTL